jgi:two-component system cell cycle response regulator
MTMRKSSIGELVPLAARIRNLQLVRLAAAAIVLSLSLAPGTIVPSESRALLVGLVGAYLAIVAIAESLWRLSGQRALSVYSVLLLVDGLFLGWLVFDTGLTVSPFRYLILLHVGAIALLASHRTGIKIALWHSLVLYIAYRAYSSGVITPAVDLGVPAGSIFRQLVVLVVALWLTAIATATFSAVNERELRRRRYDLEALARMAGDLDRITDPRDVAATLLGYLCETFEVDRGLVLAAKEDSPRVLASHPGRFPFHNPDDLAASEIVSLACERRRTLLVSEIDPEHEPGLSALLPMASKLIVCPLLLEGRAAGAVILEPSHRYRRAERRMVTMVERFCSHGALTLENAWLVEQLGAMASTDGLTGLANRRTFDASLEHELSRGDRTGGHVGLLMADIDHFKQVNDTHGHQAGDDILREVAAIMRRNCRDFDTVGRFGGEEFALVLPGMDEHAVVQAGERLRQLVESGDTSIPVTVSIGAAAAPPGLKQPGLLIAAADAALYRSKREGRNRVTATPLAASATEFVPEQAGSNGRSGSGAA